jgi:pilus assembly protein Flp/PilA
MLKMFHQFYNDESGATALEYGLIAALVSVAAIGALTQLGGALTGIFGTVSGKLNDAAAAAAASAGTGGTGGTTP